MVPRHGAIVSKAYFISSGFTGKNISGFVCFVRDNVCGKFEISFYKTRVNRFTSRFSIECN